MADDQLAALWALNLEQEEEYQAKVDTPPGSAPFPFPFPTSSRLHDIHRKMRCTHWHPEAALSRWVVVQGPALPEVHGRVSAGAAGQRRGRRGCRHGAHAIQDLTKGLAVSLPVLECIRWIRPRLNVSYLYSSRARPCRAAAARYCSAAAACACTTAPAVSARTCSRSPR